MDRSVVAMSLESGMDIGQPAVDPYALSVFTGPPREIIRVGPVPTEARRGYSFRLGSEPDSHEK